MATMTDELVSELYSIRKTKSLLEKREKELLSQIQPEVDALFDVGEELTFGSLYMRRVPGATSSIKREKLLERGVDPGIIAYATVKTEYHRYTIDEIANKKKKQSA
jgi:hypothetical protein